MMSMQQSIFGVRFCGIGAYAPERIIKNDDLTALVDTSDEWIASRTGIRERHVVSGNETVAEMGIKAAQDALNSAGIAAEAIDLIIAACSTMDTIYPAVSAQIQRGINAKNAAGFDVSLACSGFVYCMTIAEQFIRSGAAKTVLVVASDAHSRFTDWSDRNTCVLFGDGAGAAVLQATTPENDDIVYSKLYLDGWKGDDLVLKVITQNCPLVEPREAVSPYVAMNGKEVFKFAVGTVPEPIAAALASSNLSIDAIDYLVLHQANLRIMSAMSEKLGISEDKLIINLQKYGNTSAATIPLAFNEAVLAGTIRPEQTLLLCGFGAGLAWGTMILRYRQPDHRLG